MVLGAISARNMAQNTPNGTAIKRERTVIPRLPMIMGKIPYSPLVGAQSIPNRKLKKPVLSIAGIPSLNTNKIIRAMIMIEDTAVNSSPFL
jgi:hypothetical protein